MTMTRDKITIDDVLALKPRCRWTRERMQKSFGGRESLTALEMCDVDIEPVELVWLLQRAPIFSAVELRLLAARWAEQSLPIYGWAHLAAERSREAITTARRYAFGEATESELIAAHAVAVESAESAQAAALRAWAVARAAEPGAVAFAAFATAGRSQEQLADLRAVLAGELDLVAEARAVLDS
ncbi:MAG: hypothetical protein ABIH03_08865 [Pseudomonadota bacterium]